MDLFNNYLLSNMLGIMFNIGGQERNKKKRNKYLRVQVVLGIMLINLYVRGFFILNQLYNVYIIVLLIYFFLKLKFIILKVIKVIYDYYKVYGKYGKI